MFVNIIRTYRDVVAICDKELIGKKFYEGKFQLDVKENFYKGEEMDEEKTIQILKNIMEDKNKNNSIIIYRIGRKINMFQNGTDHKAWCY